MSRLCGLCDTGNRMMRMLTDNSMCIQGKCGREDRGVGNRATL